MSYLNLYVDDKGEVIRSNKYQGNQYKFLKILSWDQRLNWIILSEEKAEKPLNTFNNSVHNILNKFLHGGVLDENNYHVVQWRNTFPPGLLKLAFQTSYPYSYVKYCSYHNDILNFSRTSPNLFQFILDFAVRSNTSQAIFLDLVRTKRVNLISIIFGLETVEKKSAVKFINKFKSLDRKNISLVQMKIRDFLATGEYKKLNHYKSLSISILEIFETHPFLIQAKWMNKNNEDHTFSRPEQIIDDTLRMAENLGELEKYKNKIIREKDFPGVMRLHYKITAKFNAYIEEQRLRGVTQPFGQFDSTKNISFPPPPLEGTEHIIPIIDSNELYKEATGQNHCVYSYLQMIIDGSYYVYKVAYPERATLGIRITDINQRKFIIDQLVLATNRSISDKTFNYVNNWLSINRHLKKMELS